jgi:hypothetical protein
MTCPWRARADGAALMMRTQALRALGGWTGIPCDDEVATFAALSQGPRRLARTWR